VTSACLVCRCATTALAIWVLRVESLAILGSLRPLGLALVGQFYEGCAEILPRLRPAERQLHAAREAARFGVHPLLPATLLLDEVPTAAASLHHGSVPLLSSKALLQLILILGHHRWLP